MEEKEREEDNDDNSDLVDVTAVQLFGMSNEEFIGKETENNKGKEGHRCRYRDDNEIKALHGLYEEPKDDNKDGRDYENDGGNWDEMD